MKKLLSLLVILTQTATAQENITYQKPSDPIYKLADYTRAPSVSMDSKKEYMLFTFRNTYKTLEDLNIEEMRLAGLRINPVTNMPATTTYSNNLKIRKVSNYKAEPTQVSGLPANPNIANLTWSP